MMAIRILKLTAITLLTLMVILILSLWLVNFGFLKPQVETTVSEITGREFRIEGGFSLSLLPTPTLMIENVSLANADWGSDPAMLTLEKAYVEVSLASLLAQPIVIDRIEIINVSLLAETGPDEQVNWAVLTGQEPTEEEQSGEALSGLSIPLMIQSGDIKDIRLTYRQPETKAQTFQIDALALTGEDRATGEDKVGTLLKGTAHYGDTPLGISGTLSEHHVDADLQIDQVDVHSQIDFLADAFNFELTVSTLAQLGALFDIGGLPDTALLDETLMLKGSVAFNRESISFDTLTAAIKGIALSAKGGIENESGIINLTAKLKGDRLDDIDSGLPQLPFTLDSEFTIDNTKIDISSFQAAMGDSDVSGSAFIDAGDSLLIEAQIRSKKIDLTPFVPADESSVENSTTIEMPPPKSRYVFDEKPLPLDILQSLNLRVGAEIDRLILPEAELKQFSIKGEARNGKLKLTNSLDGYLSGNFVNTVLLEVTGDQANKQVNVELDTEVRDMKIVALSGASVPKEQVPVTNLDIHLKSAGSTPRSLASNLDGGVVVNQGAGKVSSALMQRFSGDIISQLAGALNPFAEQQEFTNWQCSLFALRFESGYGQIEGFLLQSDQLMVVGGGDIDLNDESLNIEFNTKPRTGVGVSADMFVTPFVKLGGTLAQPKVGLNNTGVLLSGGAAFLTGGMSFLYTGIMDRATASFDRCDEARAAIKAVKKEVVEEDAAQ